LNLKILLEKEAKIEKSRPREGKLGWRTALLRVWLREKK
jgi:hypothetical protein